MEAQSLPLHLNLKDIEAQVRHVLHQMRRGDAVELPSSLVFSGLRGLEPPTKRGRLPVHNCPGTWA